MKNNHSTIAKCYFLQKIAYITKEDNLVFAVSSVSDPYSFDTDPDPTLSAE